MYSAMPARTVSIPVSSTIRIMWSTLTKGTWLRLRRDTICMGVTYRLDYPVFAPTINPETEQTTRLLISPYRDAIRFAVRRPAPEWRSFGRCFPVG